MMMEFDDLNVDNRVLVIWTETQQSFEGSIDRVHNDNTFDVTYFAPIDGKIVKEFQVPRNRIQLLAQEEGYFTENANIYDEPSLAVIGLDDTHMSHSDARNLANSLTIQKLANLWKNQEPSVLQAQQRIIQKLESFGSAADLAPNIRYGASDSYSRVEEAVTWIDCASALLRIHSFISEMAKKNARAMPAPVQEEHFDQVVLLIHDFFTRSMSQAQTAGGIGDSGSCAVSPSSSSGGRKAFTNNKGTSNQLAMKSFQNLLKHLLPSLAHFLEMMRMFAYACSPTGKIAYLLLEVCFLILGRDQAQPSNPLFSFINNRFAREAKSLYNVSTLLLRYLFKRLEYRESCVQGLVQLLHASISVKPVIRPFLVGATEKDSITVATFATLMCCQSMTTDSATGSLTTERNILNGCYSAINDVISELLQRCCNKDLSDDYFTAADMLISDLLLAVQSPLFQISMIVLQLFAINIRAELRQRSNLSTATDGKRDVSKIYNALLDLLGSIAEGSARFNIDWKRDRNLAFEEHVAKLVKDRLTARWKKERPLWMGMIMAAEKTGEGSNYWSTIDDLDYDTDNLQDDEADNNTSAAAATSSSSRSKSSSSANALLSSGSGELPTFIKALDAVIEINQNVEGILADVVGFPAGAADRQNIRQHQLDGCVSLTFAILPNLKDNYDLRGLITEVRESDLYHVKLLQNFVDKFGLEVLQLTESCLYFNEESKSDVCMIIFGLWLNSLQDREESYQAVKKLLALVTQPTTGTGNSSSSGYAYKHTRYPDFLTNVLAQDTSTITEVNMIIARSLARGLVFKLLEQFVTILQESSSPIIRSKSLKMIGKVATIDSTILSFRSIKEAIETVLTDRSISVREECVKLMSGYVLSGGNGGSEEAQHYLMILLPLLQDEGISVRRSVINILKETMLKYPFHTCYHAICTALLARLNMIKEEESIKEHIVLIFQVIWFLPPNELILQTLRGLFTASSGTVPDSVSDSAQASAAELKVKFISSFLRPVELADYNRINLSLVHIRFTALQLIELLLLDTTNNRLLIASLLQSLLHGKAAGNEASTTLKAKRESSFEHCTFIYDFQHELFLRLEEQDTAAMQYLQTMHCDVSHFKIAIVGCMSLLATVHPPFVKNVDCFLPYLKLDPAPVTADATRGREKVEVCGHIIRILQASSQLHRSALKSRVEEILQDLAHIALRQPVDNVNLAVECMASLVSNVQTGANVYLQLGRICFDPVVNMAKQVHYNGASLSPVQINQLRRCLVVLGFICEHARRCNTQLEAQKTVTISASKREELEENAAQLPAYQAPIFTASTLFGCCFSAAQFALTLTTEEFVVVNAVRTFCGIFTGFPKLMEYARKINLIGDLFSEQHTSNTVRIAFLSGLRDMMIAEEKRLEQQSALQQMSDAGVSLVKEGSKSKAQKAESSKISSRANVLGAGNHYGSDSTVAGFILQQHLPQLKAFMRDAHPDIRHASLELIGTLLRQGMLLPADVTADLIMLQCDHEDDTIRSESLQILLLQDEKHPTYVEAKLVEGVEAAYDFQRVTFGTARAVLPQQAENMRRGAANKVSFFNALYAQVIATDRKRKLRFISSLLERCVADIKYRSPLPKAATSLAHLTRVLTDGQDALHKVDFLTACLASFPYNTVEEPLMAVSFISKTVPVQMGSCLASLISLLSALGLTLRNMLLDDNNTATTRATTTAAASSSSSTVAAGNRAAWEYVEASFDLDTFTNTCLALLQDGNKQMFWSRWAVVIEATIRLRTLEMLLRLKAYIKTCYSLTDDRCQAYRGGGAEESGVVYEKATPEAGVEFSALQPGRVDPLNTFSNEGLALLKQLGAPSANSQGTAQTLGQLLGTALSEDFNRVSAIIQYDADDLLMEDPSLMPATTLRRSNSKSPGSGTGGGSRGGKGRAAGGAKGASSGASSSSKRRKRKVTADLSSDDEDDDAMHLDEDFADSSSKPTATGRTSSSRAKRSTKQPTSYATAYAMLEDD